MKKYKRTDRLEVPITIPFDGKRQQFLRHLIETNDFETMIEVGVATGKSTFFLLDHIPRLKIYAIDINIKKFYNEKIKEKYGERLIPIEGYSYLVSGQIPDDSVDIIFIDADHSYEAVAKDILEYKPKLRKNGLMTGHDIDYPGVNQAVNEFICDYDVGPNFVWVEKRGNK